MPTSTRKSIGKVRNRPHIPYRHDDFQHGKRTGMAVDVVDRNSDDFEPFDKVISQADARTPPKVQGRKKKQTALSPAEEDINGEMSMDLDNSYDSPMAYYNNQRIPAGPNSIHRIGSSSRPVRHSPDVDFDKLPSPRPAATSTFSRHQSRLSGKSPGPSRLSQSFVAPHRFESLPSSDDNADGFDFAPVPPSPSPEQLSFTQMDQDEEEEEQIEDTILNSNKAPNIGNGKSRFEDERQEPTSRHAKNTRKSIPNGRNEEEVEGERGSKKVDPRRRGNIRFEEDPEDVEEEISQALNDVEINFAQGSEEEDEGAQTTRRDSNRRPKQLSNIMEEPEEDEGEVEQEREQEKPAKKARKSRKRETATENAEAQRPKKKPRTVTIATKGRGRTTLEDMTPEPNVVRLRSVSPENPEGLRRSRRYRYKPLEYWRLEKVVYGQVEDADKPRLVAPIREIVRIPKEEAQPLGGKRSRRWNRSKSKTVELEQLVYNPEEGWDDNTESQGHVLDYTTRTEVERRIAYTANMVSPTGTDNFAFQKIFGDGDFIAAGQLIIPVGSEKPSKGTKDNTYVFYVIEGAVNLKIHTTSFVICTGGCFLVPRGNVYYIKNICSRTAKLFFAQARKVPAGAEESHLLPQPPPRHSTEDADRSSNAPPAGTRETTEDRLATSKMGTTKRARSTNQ